MANSTVAMIDDFVTGVLQALDQARRTQRCGRFFAAGQKCRSARRRANQGNFPRLPTDFRRQFCSLRSRFSELLAVNRVRKRVLKLRSGPNFKYRTSNLEITAAALPQWSPTPAAT